ncbi:MAG: response regulator [Lachnospiraceae bacterium]|nr:response regulator [Lachnospiraceae bacterium]
MKLKKIILEWMESISLALFVIFAFTVMVTLSYIYTSSLVRQHLENEAENVLANTEMYIMADLQKPQTVLNVIANTVRMMILGGEEHGTIRNYITQITNSIKLDDDMMPYVVGVHGIFYCYDDRYLSSAGSFVPLGFVPSDLRWYQPSVDAGGKIVASEPFRKLDEDYLVITFSRMIFDNAGEPLGIICLEVMMAAINSRVVNIETFNDGYGMIMDANLIVIAHPDQRYIGMSIYDLNDGERIAADILSGQEFGSYDAISYLDERASLFYKRLSNGWYLGIITPYEPFYQSISNMAWFLGLVGGSLAFVLCIIIVQIARNKNKANKQTQVMLDAMPMSAEIWNQDFRMVDCNLETLRFFNLPSKQEYLTNIERLSPKYQPDGFVSTEKARMMLEEAFADGYSRFEWLHQSMEADPLPCEVILVRVPFGDDVIVIGYSRDLREQKAMIARVKAEQSQRFDAETANKAKTSFLAAMSHEIRTPMNAILGITEIQLQDEMLYPSIQEGLLMIHDAGYTLLHIINDMLDLSKIEAGKMEIRADDYNVAGMISETVQLNIMRLGSKALDFKLDITDELPSVLFGDAMRIKQILNNLLSNAFKYTERGVISLSVSIEHLENEGYVHLIFKISDTGKGMSEEQIGKIFDEYARFTETEKDKEDGVGLGMTIVQRLISLMDGEIFIESEPDAGTTFTVNLLQGYNGSEAIDKETADKLRDFDFQGRAIKGLDIIREYMPYGSVLVVDDVETNLYVAKGFLSPYGLTIDTVKSGPAAIEKIKDGNSYDVIFMDHLMPQMNGLQATGHIRALNYDKPIVALTANALAGRAEMFLENGFNDFISKPIDIRRLNDCLNRFVRDSQPQEVIEAARRQKEADTATKKAAVTAYNAKELLSSFVTDAEAAFIMIEKSHQNGYHTGEDIGNYVTAVHGMKSALINTGKIDLSGMARQLELAGNEEDIVLLETETPIFLAMLRAAIESAKDEISAIDQPISGDEEDKDLLRNKLALIKAACATYDRKEAKRNITELGQHAWSRETSELIKLIAENVLRGYYEEAEAAATEGIGKI